MARRDERVMELERQVQRLHEVNAKLVAQLEAQYRQIITVADTIQSVHVVGIKSAISDAPSCSPSYQDFKADLETTASRATSQLASLSAPLPGMTVKEQAAALRQLEDRARTWAKKFLHKVKAAAAAAESRVNGGGADLAPSPARLAPIRASRDDSRASSRAPSAPPGARSPFDRNTAESLVRGSAGAAAYHDDDASSRHYEERSSDMRGTATSEEHIAIDEANGNSASLSTPHTDESDRKKKRMFFNRLFSGSRK